MPLYNKFNRRSKNPIVKKTNGGELMYALKTDKPGQEYIGYYYIIRGKKYDGKNLRTARLLVPYEQSKMVVDYMKLTDKRPKKYTIINHNNTPTKEDYEKGYMYRYFAKKLNDTGLKIYEQTEESYANVETNELYQTLTLKWKLIGTVNDEFNNDGTIMSHGIRDTNIRTIDEKEKEMPGIKAFVTDYLKFARF